MDNEIALSIAIPTYNRAKSLENLLRGLLPQVGKSGSSVEVCISDNGSPDATREVVMNFEKEYPGLIRYRANEKNLGVDKNILLVMEMARGRFIWTLGDDDTVAENAVEEIVGFTGQNKNVGLIVMKEETYFIDAQTGERIFYHNTLSANKAKVFIINKKDIIGLSFPEIAFLSVLVFNNAIIKKMFAEHRPTIEKGIGTHHVHMPLCSLMFLAYPDAAAIAFNKHPMVYRELPRFKFFIEDKFMLHYQVQKKINKIVLSYNNISSYAPVIARGDKKLTMVFIKDLAVMRAFGTFNYFSYAGCLKLFFREAAFIDALLFSFTFLILSITPPVVLTSLYKVLLMARHGKNWKVQWDVLNNVSSITSSGTRRRNDLEK